MQLHMLTNNVHNTTAACIRYLRLVYLLFWVNLPVNTLCCMFNGGSERLGDATPDSLLSLVTSDKSFISAVNAAGEISVEIVVRVKM